MVKKIFCSVLLYIVFLGVTHAQIQADPAHWAYGIKKLSVNTYEVHLQCTIDTPWHIYAQKQTRSFIGTATAIAFTKNVGLTIVGKPLELGKKELYSNKEAGISNYEYVGKVDFVQKVLIKPGLKQLKGTIVYQTCNRERCLSPNVVDFNIPIK